MSTPESIGRYPVVSELGRGGMGVVYHARDPVLDRPVAIKVLSGALAQSGDQLSRFEREARILARFNHPGIATIYGLDQTDDGQRFLVLELVEGESLAARLKREPLDVREALDILRQVAAAVLAAHRRGVVHRDLKPANVLIDPEGTAKVLDFGLAKALPGPFGDRADSVTEAETINVDVRVPPTSTEVTESFHTRVGEMMGTPSYMSPEQIRGQVVGEESDVFAFGCLIYECLTGAKAFAGETFSDLVAATLTTEPDLAVLPEETPLGIRRLIERCLVKDAAQRLGDMEVAAAEIATALGTPTAVRVVGERLERAPNNLPRSLSSFVGRETELARAQELLAANRLLTLTGPAGAGKTRLALRLAEEAIADFPDGIWLVELGQVATAEQMKSVVVSALGLREEAGKDCRQVVLDGLSGRTSLVLLDNCEHLLAPAAQLVQDVLQHAPAVRFLTTSRESLGIEGETVFVVPSMAHPESEVNDEAHAREFAAVRLFVERARAARPGFRLTEANAAAVARVCRRLDGIPLAIELAAARVRSMSPERIADRLTDSFRLLTGGSRTALPRQQTMRAAFDWSFRLLSNEEQHLFSRLAVFVGGFTLEAAESVCADESEEEEASVAASCPLFEEWQIVDVLTALVEKSLVQYEEDDDGEGRYRLLKVGRAFGLEELARCGGVERLRDRHLDYVLALADAAEPALVAAGQREWLARLALESENVEAALEWCRATPGGGEKALRIVGGIWRFWSIRGQRAAGRHAVEVALAHAEERASVPRVKALTGLGVLLRYAGEFEAAHDRLEEAVAMARELDEPGVLAQALFSLATVRLFAPRARELSEARPLLEEARDLFREEGDARGEAATLNALGWRLHQDGDLAGARALHEESLALRRAAGDRHGMATSLSSLGIVELEQGKYAEAMACLEESGALFDELGARGAVGWVLGNLALVHDRGGDLEAAEAALNRSLSLVRNLREKPTVALRLADLASVRARRGYDESAMAALGEAVSLAQELQTSAVSSACLDAAARVVFAVRADASLAAMLYGVAEAQRRSSAPSLVENLKWQRDSWRAVLVEALGEPAFEAACAEGAKWSIAEALARVERECRVN